MSDTSKQVAGMGDTKDAPLVMVSLSAAQLAECQHKACIVRDEPDLQESYAIAPAQAEAMAEKLMAAKPGRIEMTKDEAACLAGELENAAEIDADNLQAGDEASRSSLVSMRDGARKLRAALSKAGG